MWEHINSMTDIQVGEFFHRLSIANPTPKSALVFHSPYTLLIAVILSARSTDKSVNKATRFLFTIADTPAKMLALGESNLKIHIRAIGLFHSKAKYILSTSRLLIENYCNEVPNNRISLEQLPGVGRKGANVILNLAFGHPVIAVDTHVFRVSNRSGLSCGRTPLEVEKKLMHIVPERYLLHAHHWLILHGRHVCKARNADCARCIVHDLCLWDCKQ